MSELLKTLFVTTPGTSLHLDGDALRVYHPDKPGRHLLPLIRLDDIVVFNGVTVTDDLMHRCAADARSVTWLTRNGKFLARVSGPCTGNPHLRIQQLTSKPFPISPSEHAQVALNVPRPTRSTVYCPSAMACFAPPSTVPSNKSASTPTSATSTASDPPNPLLRWT